MISDLKHLAPNELKAIKRLKSLLGKKYGQRIKEIKIFGSKARGDYETDSDIDVFIVFNEDIDWCFEREVSDLVYNIDLEYDVLFNLIIYSKRRLGEKRIESLPFIRNVKREGIRI